MKILLAKTLTGSLKPAFDSDHDKLKKIKAGAIVECEIKQPRNILFHRKFFALINLVYSNQEVYNNLDHLRKDLTVVAGYYDVRYNFEGVEIYEPKSISFASMDEAEFNDYYSAIIHTICNHWPYTKEELEEEILQYF